MCKEEKYIIDENSTELIITDKSFKKFWKTNKAELQLKDSKFVYPEFELKHPKNCFFNYNYTQDINNVDTVLLGVPYAGGSLLKDSNTNFFPMYLRNYSISRQAYYNLENFSASGIYSLSEERLLFHGLTFCDLGNLVLKTNSLQELAKLLDKFTQYVISNHLQAIEIGGDHSITYANVYNLAKYINKSIIVFIFDAHHDCRNTLYMLDSDINHANFVRKLLKINNIANIIQIGGRGIRSMAQMYTNEKLIQISSQKISLELLKETVNNVLKKYPNSVGYISIDLDVIDPIQFPYVDFPVAGGIHVDVVNKLIEYLYKSNLKIIGTDIVEGLPNGTNSNNYDIPLEVLSYCLDGTLQQKNYFNNDGKVKKDDLR